MRWEYSRLRICTGCQSATDVEAYELAGDLELQYDARGPRDPRDVRRLDKPTRVGVWQRDAGELTSWVREDGRWLGRVKFKDGRVSWIDQADLRPEPLAD